MRTVTSRRTKGMSKLNPQNERIKRDYLRYLKGGAGQERGDTRRGPQGALSLRGLYGRPRLQDVSPRAGNRLQGAPGRDEWATHGRNAQPRDTVGHACRVEGVLHLARVAARLQVENSRTGYRLFQPVDEGQRDREGQKTAGFPEPRTAARRNRSHARRNCDRAAQPRP